MTFRWHINHMPDGKIAPLARLDIVIATGIHSYACRLDLNREFASPVVHLTDAELADAMLDLDKLLGPSPDIQPAPTPKNLEPVDYYDKRAWAYPSIQEQLDMLYHDKKAGTDTWLSAIDAVKSKYPKE